MFSLLPTLLLNLFFYLYFTLQVKPQLETGQGELLPHQTVGNLGNGNPLRSAYPSAQKGGYGKKNSRFSTVANMGFSFLFRTFLPEPTRMPLTFYGPILYGTNCLHRAPPPLRRQPPHPPRLAIGTLNIRDDRGFRLAQAIWAVECGGFDVMLLTDTKIQTEPSSHKCLGYDMTCSKVRPYSSRGYQGGVGLVTG